MAPLRRETYLNDHRPMRRPLSGASACDWFILPFPYLTLPHLEPLYSSCPLSLGSWQSISLACLCHWALLYMISNICMYPLYICPSFLWGSTLRLGLEMDIPPVLASLVSPSPSGPHGVIRGPQWRGQPPRPSPATTVGASAFSFSFYARKGTRSQGMFIFTDAFCLVHCDSIFCHIVWL